MYRWLKSHPNTQFTKDCKLASVTPIMLWLNNISRYLEAGVVGQIVRIWPGDN